MRFLRTLKRSGKRVTTIITILELIISRLAFEAKLIWNHMPEGRHQWVSRQICLWRAPEWLCYPKVLCLGRSPEYRALSGLFQTTLSIPNANHDNYLDYLAYIKARDFPSEEEAIRIPKIYQELNGDEVEKETKEYIRCVRLFLRL